MTNNKDFFDDDFFSDIDNSNSWNNQTTSSPSQMGGDDVFDFLDTPSQPAPPPAPQPTNMWNMWGGMEDFNSFPTQNTNSIPQNWGFEEDFDFLGGNELGGNNLSGISDINDFLENYTLKEREIVKIFQDLIFQFYWIKSKPIDKLEVEDFWSFLEYTKEYIKITYREYVTEFAFSGIKIPEGDFLKKIEKLQESFKKLAKHFKNPLIDEETPIKNVFVYRNKVYVNYRKTLDVEHSLKVMYSNSDNWQIYIWNDLIKWNPILLNQMKELRMTHIVWTSWSGKSVLLRNMVASGLQKYGNMRFFILEKATDFDNFFQFKNIEYKNTVWKMGFEEIITLFLYFFLEFEKRRQIMAKVNASSLDEYNDKVPPKERLPYEILLIDEFKELRDVLQKQSIGKIDLEKKFITYLSSLVQVTRSVWLFFWLATQQVWDDKGIPLVIRGNLQTHIIWKLDSSQIQQASFLVTEDRKLIWGNKLYEWDFLISAEKEKWLIRSPYFDDEAILRGKLYQTLPKREKPISDIYDFSNKRILNLMKKNISWLEIDILDINDRLKDYGFSEEYVDAKFDGIVKLSMIWIANIFVNWLEKTIRILRRTTIVPPDFNIETEIDALLNQEKYKPITVLFVYMLYLYQNKFREFIDKNFKLSTWPNQRIILSGDDEALDELISKLRRQTKEIFTIILL